MVSRLTLRRRPAAPIAALVYNGVSRAPSSALDSGGRGNRRGLYFTSGFRAWSGIRARDADKSSRRLERRLGPNGPLRTVDCWHDDALGPRLRDHRAFEN